MANLGGLTNLDTFGQAHPADTTGRFCSGSKDLRIWCRAQTQVPCSATSAAMTKSRPSVSQRRTTLPRGSGDTGWCCFPRFKI
ncbi:hypothetical protein B0T14DRAFT_514367 [Immersiella caudata]|uniref:Uncharacterized protein n=1 Tax=Immersiella caudata TaxID=314043 RepID=A0AA39WW59_9PEZI|nr:hypothetical protein B0T14DRAFT_514367 [Immersiella caudata]